jgi:antitoxin component YwqK of YwqJK toxin-antitoxin module
MKRIVTAIVGMLMGILAFSQKSDGYSHHTTTQTKGITVFSNFPQPHLPYKFPEQGLIDESQNDKLLYSTTVKNKRLCGKWQSWYQNGVNCDSGTLVNNLPDGEWKYWNEHGQLMAIRTYSANKFHQVLDEMQRYNPKRNFYYLSSLFQHNRQAALQHLNVDYSFPKAGTSNSHKSLRELVIANISGIHFYKPVFDHCLQHGLYMNFFADGTVKDSGYYKNGLRFGKWIHRDTVGGTWRQGAYHNGDKIKEWKLFSKEDKLLELIFYNNNGKISWRKKINRQGS